VSWEEGCCCFFACSVRHSCCRELLEISHIRTIYHIFVAILIVFMLNTFVSDIMEQGRCVTVYLSLCACLSSVSTDMEGLGKSGKIVCIV